MRLIEIGTANNYFTKPSFYESADATGRSVAIQQEHKRLKACRLALIWLLENCHQHWRLEQNGDKGHKARKKTPETAAIIQQSVVGSCMVSINLS